MQNKELEKDAFNISTNKSVLNIEAQKELVTHSIQTSFKYSILSLLVISPVVFLMIGLVLLVVFKLIK